MKKLIGLMICLLTTCICFSQNATVGKKDPNAMMCLRESILRRAAADITRYDECKLMQENNDKNLAILNNEIRFMDSVIESMKDQYRRKNDIVNLWQDKYKMSQADVKKEQAEKKVIQDDFSSFKRKDKLKVGVLLGLLALSMVGWASK